jgi:hypothetical protein
VTSSHRKTQILSGRYTFIVAGIFLCFICYSQKYTLITADDYLNARGEVYFSFIISHSDIGLLSKTISIDRIKGDTVYAYANADGFKSFLEYKLNYVILVPPSLQVREKNLKNALVSGQWNSYPSYDEYISIMDSFEIKYPSISKLFEIGTSTQGHKLIFIKISDNVGQKEAEPEFMFTSSIHGDEVTGYILLLHLIDYLLSNYNKDPFVTQLVDNVEIWINPLANPDGTYKTGNSSVFGATRFNANNVDLNRNYPDPQAGDHPDGQAWQPETVASMDFMKAHNFVFSANYHGGSEVLNYPWDTWSRLHPDDNWFQSVSKEYADTAKLYGGSNYFSDVTTNGYTNGYAWYTVQGGRQDYMTYFRNGREITIEVSIPKMPDASALPDYWNYNYKAMLHYIEQCLFGIHGIVTDSVTGAPLKCKVEILGHDVDNSFIFSSQEHGNYHRLIYPGTYSLKFSASGYSDKIIRNVTVENTNSTPELNVKLVPLTNPEIKVIPNPFSIKPDELQIPLQTEGYVTIQIYSCAGAIIYQSEDKFLPAGLNSVTDLPIAQFARGIYLCKINFNGSPLKTMKLVKL